MRARAQRTRTVVASALLIACNPDTNSAANSSATDTTADTSASSAEATVDDSASVATAPGDSTSAASSDTEAVVPCDQASRCLPALEAEWRGPVTVRDPYGSPCDDDFPIVAATVYDELNAPPAECSCQCATNGTPTCMPTSSLRRWDDGDCEGEEDAESSIDQYCTAISAAPGAGLLASAIMVQGVTCEVEFESYIAEARFDSRYSICARAEQDPLCESGGTCLPKVDPEPLCIWREGDFPCPTPWSATRQLRYREFIDERRCTECTCNQIDTECEGLTMYLFGTSGCNEVPVGGVTPGGACEELSLQGAAAARVVGKASFDDPDCSMEVVGGISVGAAGPTSPVTICCMDL